MRFTSRRFRRFLSKKQKKARTKKQRRLTRRKQTQKGGGNTLTRDIPNAAIVVNPGQPPREEDEEGIEDALD